MQIILHYVYCEIQTQAYFRCCVFYFLWCGLATKSKKHSSKNKLTLTESWWRGKREKKWVSVTTSMHFLDKVNRSPWRYSNPSTAEENRHGQNSPDFERSSCHANPTSQLPRGSNSAHIKKEKIQSWGDPCSL
jgi:hypothetical protein